MCYLQRRHYTVTVEGRTPTTAVKKHWLEEQGCIGRGGSCTAMSWLLAQMHKQQTISTASSGHHLPWPIHSVIGWKCK